MMSTKTTTNVSTDVEVGETTPLLNAEAAVSGLPSSVPLQDLKAESLKEKAVAGVALVGCTCCSLLHHCLSSLFSLTMI
jgi:hypothetical protein